jgi:beta-ribofuranosylaminobenzene 5'-phosphate synthase
LEDLRTILLLQPIEFVICSGFDAHAGFGSGTALSLAAIESLHLLNKVSYSESDIVSASGRGGVSGIGIRTYFAGGLWVDAGVPNGGATFRSSDQFHEVNRQSTSLMRVAMPEWVVGICIPSAVSLTPREIEDSFFAAFPGASEGEVESLAYQIFMGLIPAVVEGDNETFSIALDRVQTTYWKRAERSLHSSVKPIESVLRSLGAKGIGLSSIGPGLFFLDPGEERVRSILGDGLVEARTIVARPSNEGRRLTHA